MRRGPRPVLCCIDESAAALPAADLGAAIACLFDAPLVLAHAVPPRASNEGWGVLGAASIDMLRDTEERERPDGEEVLRRAIGRLRLSADTETLLVSGDPGHALVEAAGAIDAAAIVVGTRRHGRLHRALLGSVSGRVVAGASCPVVVVGHQLDHKALATGPILSAVDGSADAERAALVAATTADRLGRELVLVHVLPEDPALVADPTGELGMVAGLWDDIAREDGWTLLTAIAATVGVRARLVAEPALGTVAAALARVARREDAACIMVGSRGRGPFRSALLDVVPTSAAVESPCPLVVIPERMTAPIPLAERPRRSSGWGLAATAVGRRSHRHRRGPTSARRR